MTQFQTLVGLLNTVITNQVRILARLGETPPVVPIVPPVVVPPVVAGHNPFIAWKAEGLSMETIILWRFGRALTAAEWDLAVAAGYPRENGLQRTTGPSGFPSGFDLTGTEGGTGRRNVLSGGVAYPFIWVAPKNGPAYWQFEVNPGDRTAKTVSFNGDAPVPLPEWTTLQFEAVAGVGHALTVQLDGTATVAITVRYG